MCKSRGSYSRSHTGIGRKDSWALGMLGPGVLERSAGMFVSDGGKTFFYTQTIIPASPSVLGR